jgi:predicted Rossmann fold flavoprotein
VESIRRGKNGFRLETTEGPMTCDRVILCCGGLAAGKLGGSKSGYQLLESLGHSCTKLYPALVQLRTDPTWVKSLKGVRADAALTLRAGDRVLAQTAGEVQFTEYGISGPAVFELSRHAAAGPTGQVLELDLLRTLEPGALEQLLAKRQQTMSGLTLENLLTGTVHNRLGRTLIRAAGYDLNAPVTGLRAPDRKKIAATVHRFCLPVTGNQGMDAAQVTAGGIRTREFDPETLESRLVPGLYAAGEVLDIDGDCGGWNLQWAWSSGYLAGQLK